ncbi:hypothetical protein ACYBSK_18750 [Streptomyces sp. BYX5S]
MSARVRDVVRDVIVDVAPDEVLPLDRLAALDETQVTRLFARRADGGDGGPRRPGDVDVTGPLTPVVWTAVTEAVGSAGPASPRRARRPAPFVRLLAPFRRPPRPPAYVPPLCAEQLDVVGERVRERVRQARLGEDAAATVAAAVVSRLALEAERPARTSR